MKPPDFEKEWNSIAHPTTQRRLHARFHGSHERSRHRSADRLIDERRQSELRDRYYFVIELVSLGSLFKIVEQARDLRPKVVGRRDDICL